LESGRTTLSLKPNWREQTLKNDEAEVPLQSVAVEASLEYDNYDFPFNPSRGSFQRLSYEKDFDDDPSFGEWETWSLELSKVFDLGATESAHQRVLAFSFWTAYVPTWETETRDGVEVITRRPPQFEGAVLGGLNRMRAYENERFHDKSAIYYSAELRMMPTWQPLKAIGWLDWADISWWQWVVFAEVGQVAPHYSFDDLHDDLHADGGISIRAMIHEAVCRLDFAAGEEGARVVAMYLHPF
jgi:outer membrane protein assembly factor BamA